MFLLAVLFGIKSAMAAEAQFDIAGYSPELNAIFAQAFVVPDDRKCEGYILDLKEKIKYVLPAAPGVAEALIALGEGEELASCQLREFEPQLEIKLKSPKTYSEDEKKLVQPFEKADWKRPLPGFKSGSVDSLGAWLKKHRPQWHPERAVKLYELGVAEAEDKGWVDGYMALMLAADWKPGYSTQLGRDRARQLTLEAEKLLQKKGDRKSVAQGVLALEMATRLDSKNASALLALAQHGTDYVRSAQLVARALRVNPVLTTRVFREHSGFFSLRCEASARHARQALPADLTNELMCGD